MQADNPPRLPTYAEATRTEINQPYEHHSTAYPAYPNSTSPYTTSALPNYPLPPSVPLYQYTNNQLPTNTPAARHIHIITDTRPQTRSFGCTRRQGIIWGFIFGLLIFAGLYRIIMSHHNQRH